jgi:hypothetical protein
MMRKKLEKVWRKYGESLEKGWRKVGESLEKDKGRFF